MKRTKEGRVGRTESKKRHKGMAQQLLGPTKPKILGNLHYSLTFFFVLFEIITSLFILHLGH